MARRVYTVITTSGWQGDGWSYRGQFDTRTEAEAYAKEVSRADPQRNGYITAVIGSTKACPDHGPFCCIGDTSRLNVARHLRSRKAHISEATLY